MQLLIKLYKMNDLIADDFYNENDQLPLPTYKEFEKEKEEFEKNKIDIEKSKHLMIEECKRFKEKVIEWERLIDVEKDKINKLYQENMELKHALQQSKK